MAAEAAADTEANADLDFAFADGNLDAQAAPSDEAKSSPPPPPPPPENRVAVIHSHKRQKANGGEAIAVETNNCFCGEEKWKKHRFCKVHNQAQDNIFTINVGKKYDKNAPTEEGEKYWVGSKCTTPRGRLKAGPGSAGEGHAFVYIYI